MSDKPRVIITTDMEVDDMNSLIHLALYLNELDVEAIVYTASQYHFLGDGVHTLGEVTPHYRTSGKLAYEGRIGYPHPDPEAASLTSYRPFPQDWIEQFWLNEYTQAWPYLAENATGYPSPAEMLAHTYRGNVEFEGDVRFDTPGSNAIKRAILDDDPRPLWLLSWGGVNTIVRALMAIAEDYQDTPLWEIMRDCVYQKVRILGVNNGVGQDNSWLDHGQPLYPELTLLRAEFTYGHYLSAKTEQADCRHLFQAPWPHEHLINGNGPLMARYMLYGDGKVYEGEPERFQFGLNPVLDWGFDGMEPIRFNAGDFLAEGDSMTYIPLLSQAVGLRWPAEEDFDTLLGRMYRDGDAAPLSVATFATDAPNAPQNPYERAYQEEFAARAQWSAHHRSACNHPPVISEVTPDIEAAPGEGVVLSATANDPDGGELRASWWFDPLASTCSQAVPVEVDSEAVEGRITARVTVPANAPAGCRLVFTLEVQDQAARPITRYAQVVVTVR